MEDKYHKNGKIGQLSAGRMSIFLSNNSDQFNKKIGQGFVLKNRQNLGP